MMGKLCLPSLTIGKAKLNNVTTVMVITVNYWIIIFAIIICGMCFLALFRGICNFGTMCSRATHSQKREEARAMTGYVATQFAHSKANWTITTLLFAWISGHFHAVCSKRVTWVTITEFQASSYFVPYG